MGKLVGLQKATRYRADRPLRQEASETMAHRSRRAMAMFAIVELVCEEQRSIAPLIAEASP
jgi:hypothetical protein